MRAAAAVASSSIGVGNAAASAEAATLAASGAVDGCAAKTAWEADIEMWPDANS